MNKVKRKKGASSVAQRKLLGYAYACATGQTKNCPPAIKDVAKSFTKNDKKKGLSNLRRFAKTKHEGLPQKVSEDNIIKFSEFIMINERHTGDKDNVIDYLYSLKNPDINGYVNEFLTTSNSDQKEEYIEDILLELGDIVEADKYNWVSKELKKF